MLDLTLRGDKQRELGCGSNRAMALPFGCTTGRLSPWLLARGPSPSFSGLMFPVHRQQHSRDSSRSSKITVMDSRRAAILTSRRHLSVVMASTNPTFAVSDVDLKTDDFSTLKLPPLPDKLVLAGVGLVSLDFLASVASFPDPDAKIRTVEALSQGGGNVGNSMTAAARLGLRPRIFSKLSNDAAGVGCCKELELNGVDVSHIVVAEEGVSPFTYVIVDEETKTRTCIHTPGYPPFIPEELSPAAISSFLNGADLLYLDGRFPDATLLIAEEARTRQLPIIVDAERKREQLDEILPFADYLVTSAKFPQIWTEAPTLAEGLISLAMLLPRVKFIIVTQGSKGCIMLERSSSGVVDILDPNSTLSSLQREAEQLHTSKPMVFSSKVGILQVSSNEKNSNGSVVGRLLVGTAAPIEKVVDTTGAGDAFVGGISYGLLAGFPPEKLLPLGATVAAAKCEALGARSGLPMRNDPRLLPCLL